MLRHADLQELLVQLQLIKQHQGTQSVLTCWPRYLLVSPGAVIPFTPIPVQLLQLQTICSNISACSPALHQQPCCYSLPDILCESDREPARACMAHLLIDAAALLRSSY